MALIAAEKIYKISKEKEIFSLDAPVSGGDLGAREGKLAIMVGGDRDIYDKVMPFFEIIGENIAHMGKAGSGQNTKMANQILIADTMIGVVESLLYAYKTEMDLDFVIDIIGKGAASSWSINTLGRRIAKGDFDPGFFIKHFIKDMGIALDEAKRMNLALPGLALVHQFYIAATSLGYPRLSRRVNKMGFCSKMCISLIEELRKYIQTYKMHNKIKHIKYFSRFVYDQLGFNLCYSSSEKIRAK